MTYGVFKKSPPFMATVLGVHDGRVAKGSSPFSREQDSLSDSPKYDLFPEAAYQARLWCFWGLYIRDCANRLYFGWPHALDNRAVTAELPRIEGCVGFGPKRSAAPSAVLPSTLPTLIGKRRDTKQGYDKHGQNKKRPHIDSQGERRWPTVYRSNVISSDEEEEEEEEETATSGEASDCDEEFSDHLGAMSKSDTQSQLGSSKNPSTRGLFRRGDRRIHNRMEDIQAFPVLSRQILVKQSRKDPGVRGEIRKQEMEAEESQTLEMELHMDRLKLLMESEQDPTDNGTFARRLFLEEIRLWTIGRRVAIYLSDRAAKRDLIFGGPTTNAAFASASAPCRPQLHSDIQSMPYLRRQDDAQLHPAAEWSKQAWLLDGELQTLQADLIAWERDLPDHLQFRSDVESEDIDHRINGKMSKYPCFPQLLFILFQLSAVI